MTIKLFVSFLREYPIFIPMNVFVVSLIPINEIYLSRLYGSLFESIQKGMMSKELLTIIVIVTGLLQLGFCVSDYLNSKQHTALQGFCRGEFLRKIFHKLEHRRIIPDVANSLNKINKVQHIIGEWYSKMTGYMIPVGIQVICTTFYLMSIDVYLALITIVVVSVLVLFAVNVDSVCGKNTEYIDGIQSKIQSKMSDILTNYFVVFKENKLHDEIIDMNELQRDYANVHLNMTKCTILYRLVLGLIIVIFLSTYSIRCYQISKNKLVKNAALYSVIMMMANMVSNMVYMVSMYRDLIMDSVQLKTSGYMEYEPTRRRSDDPTCMNNSLSYVILEVKDLSYKYPGKELFTIQSMNFSVSRGETVAITGDIGSGKSTLIKLLLRMINPTSGSIYVHQRCIWDYSLKSYYRNIGFIPQNASLFDRTVLDNILYENNGVNEQMVVDIIKQLQVEHHFSNGLHVMASTLSGGQRQLVWMLRIYFKKPLLIIMDEPTASIDEPTRKIFANIIETVLKDSTIIIITHDKFVESICDKTIALKQS